MPDEGMSGMSGMSGSVGGESAGTYFESGYVENGYTE